MRKNEFTLTKEQVVEMTTMDYQRKAYGEFVHERFYIGEWEAEEVIDGLLGIIDGDNDEMLQENIDDIPNVWPEYFAREDLDNG